MSVEIYCHDLFCRFLSTWKERSDRVLHQPCAARCPGSSARAGGYRGLAGTAAGLQEHVWGACEGPGRRWQVIHLQNKGRFSGILCVFSRKNLHPSKDGLCQVTHPAPPAPNAQNFDPSLLFPHTSLPLAPSLLPVPLHFFFSEDWGLWPALPKGGQGGHSAPGTPAAPGQTGACRRA